MVDHPTLTPAAPASHPGRAGALRLRSLTLGLRATPAAPAGPPLVRDVSFDLLSGRTLALVGESGSGKTLTALSLMGLLPPAVEVRAGEALLPLSDPGVNAQLDIFSLRPSDLRSIRGRRIAMIFQEPMTALNPVMTIGEQMVEAVRAHQSASEHDARRVCAEALESVGIRDAAHRLRQYPHEFSGGMRQRVLIAMALIVHPSVLIADEPTTALDAAVQETVLHIIRERQRSLGMAVLLISHSLPLVAAYADDVCIMLAGRIVEHGPAARILTSPHHPYTRALLECIPAIGRRTPRLPAMNPALRAIPTHARLHEVADSHWVVPTVDEVKA